MPPGKFAEPAAAVPLETLPSPGARGLPLAAASRNPGAEPDAGDEESSSTAGEVPAACAPASGLVAGSPKFPAPGFEPASAAARTSGWEAVNEADPHALGVIPGNASAPAERAWIGFPLGVKSFSSSRTPALESRPTVGSAGIVEEIGRRCSIAPPVDFRFVKDESRSPNSVEVELLSPSRRRNGLAVLPAPACNGEEDWLFSAADGTGAESGIAAEEAKTAAVVRSAAVIVVVAAGRCFFTSPELCFVAASLALARPGPIEGSLGRDKFPAAAEADAGNGWGWERPS